LKPQLRLEWRGQDGQNETEQPDVRQLRRFHYVINSDKVFGTHNYGLDLFLGGMRRFLALS
jgi:hypothetical protein